MVPVSGGKGGRRLTAARVAGAGFKHKVSTRLRGIEGVLEMGGNCGRGGEPLIKDLKWQANSLSRDGWELRGMGAVFWRRRLISAKQRRQVFQTYAVPFVFICYLTLLTDSARRGFGGRSGYCFLDVISLRSGDGDLEITISSDIGRHLVREGVEDLSVALRDPCQFVS